MDPRQLSHELRNTTSPDLERRRAIIALSAFGALLGQIVAFYQTGIVKTLPDPPIPLFDSARVDASNYAYKRLDTPDGLMMVTTFTITAWLAGAGGRERARRQPLLPVLMGVKLAFDAATTVKLAQEEWAENKALCFYCQLASLGTFVSLILAVPEFLRGLGHLVGGRR
jgi:uncharacterized membrane protein